MRTHFRLSHIPPGAFRGILLALIVASSPLLAVTPPVVNLPPTPVTASGVIPNPNGSSYVQVTLSNVPSGYSVTNGIYNGWCIDYYGHLQTASFNLYDSYGGVDGDVNPPLPSDVVLNGQTAWNEVNWIINYPTGYNNDEPGSTPVEVQDAIWTLIDPFYPTAFNDAVTVQLVIDAQTYGASFIPGPGQLVAIALVNDGIKGPGVVPNVQDLIITLPIPGGGTDVFEVNYFTNKNAGVVNAGGTATSPDDTVDIVNPGLLGAGNERDGTGDLCAMIYVIDTAEELQECCGCLVTPNQLIELSVQRNLLTNPNNGVPIHSGTIKLIKSVPVGMPAGEYDNSVCHPEAPVPTPTLRAWITHTRTITYGASQSLVATTESLFSAATLSSIEKNFLATECGFIQAEAGAGRCTCPSPLP